MKSHDIHAACKSLIKEPRICTFVTTYKCTSTCNNCCFQCSPYGKHSLTKQQMANYLMQIKRDFPSIKLLVLTGGECTILPYITEIIELASHHFNLKVRIVTNAHWAKSYNHALSIIKKWKIASLSEINYSTGDEHLEYVPFANIKNAIMASIEEGMTPFVNIETADGHKFNNMYFIKDNTLSSLILQNKLIIANGLWINFKDKEKLMQKSNDIIYPPHQRCDNILNGITITPDNRMKTCCGLVSRHTKFLDIGNAHKYSLRQLYNNQFHDFVKIWLHTEGPYNILKYIYQYDKDINPEDYHHLHQCLICAMILNNQEILRIIQQHYKDIYDRIIMKYYILQS